jgi:endonuclease/exonuclease/phosphatase family metal-dependent hydrolase
LQEDLDDHGEVEGRLYKHFKDVWANKVDGKTVLNTRGEQKNSIMTRFPVVFEDCVDISLPDRQPRCMVRADVRYTPHADLVVTILCTHFGLSRKERRVQALKVAHYIASDVPKRQPLLLVGDFNDWIRRLTSIFSGIGLQDAFVHSRGRHIPTYPAILPLLSLDRVYFAGLDLISSRVIKEAGWYGNSDHLPVAATFRPPEMLLRSTLVHHPESRL